jgi:hypothetical protein
VHRDGETKLDGVATAIEEIASDVKVKKLGFQ